MRIPRNEPLTSQTRSAAEPARKDGPERRCILTGEHDRRDALIRLAISPDGLVLPDALARAPGRGAWIGVTRHVLAAAIASGRLRGALARAFKGAPLTIPDDLPGMIEQALTQAVLQRLGMEMRAGRVVLGSDRITDQARLGKIAWLGHACDASEDGCRKLDQAFRVGTDQEGSGIGGVRLPLDRAALSVALGRENVVHLALADPRSAERVMIPLARLLHFIGAADNDGRSAPDGNALPAATAN